MRGRRAFFLVVALLSSEVVVPDWARIELPFRNIFVRNGVQVSTESAIASFPERIIRQTPSHEIDRLFVFDLRKKLGNGGVRNRLIWTLNYIERRHESCAWWLCGF